MRQKDAFTNPRGSKYGRGRAGFRKNMMAEGFTPAEAAYATGLQDERVANQEALDAIKESHPLYRAVAELRERVATLERQVAALQGKPAGIIERMLRG